jgi:hypothetical protein
VALQTISNETGQMKKISVTSLAILLTLIGVTPSPAGARADLTLPSQGINISESQIFLSAPPALFGNLGIRSQFLCSSLGDETCTAASSIWGWNQLPPCISPITTNCISSVFAVDESGKKTEGNFLKYATPDSKYDYPASETNNLPQGKGQGGIWQLPGVIHAGGNDRYFASTFLYLSMKKSAGVKVTNEKFEFTRFESGINPVNEITGNFTPAFPLDSTNEINAKGRGDGIGSGSSQLESGPNSCLVLGANNCYIPQEFPKDYRFGMRVILGAAMQGWFHGRIFQPIIDVQSDSTRQVLTFEALPVRVPTLYERVNTSDLGAEFTRYLSGNIFFSEGGSRFTPGNSGKDAIEMAGYWLPLVKDKATTSGTYWNVRSLEGNQDPSIERCSTNSAKLAGVVSTNSLVYSAGPPTYNKAEGTLDYKLLSPHFTADGEEAIGTYDLALRSDVARCIYGFSKAPIQAVVSIVGDEGENKVATTLIREKDGWLTLSANGFTFSSPTIRVKLSQEVSSTSRVPAKVKNKKTSIICIKGQKTQKVNGVNPKCPAGFKRK